MFLVLHKVNGVELCVNMDRIDAFVGTEEGGSQLVAYEPRPENIGFMEESARKMAVRESLEQIVAAVRGQRVG